ncbi:hypothetical protein [Roseovarius autotrophicus]|uniref:hypothetical protein n=1 Tax=Roseovarius autotrophicus TaxID=2824121 RepID=UPI0019D86789|nr:hypothetical protein [Roseovarius autotrophicus]MBE0454311.1 hypothetical protein [Roseovarius sp.]
MIKFGTLALAAILGISSSLPVVAQQAFARQGSETALEMASRIGACGNGASIASANFAQGGSLLEVRCAAGTGGDLSGGLGSAGAVAAGVVGIAIIAAAASGGGSSSSTGTN